MGRTTLALGAAATITLATMLGAAREAQGGGKPTSTIVWLTLSRFGGKLEAKDERKLASLLKGPGFKALGEDAGYKAVAFDPGQMNVGDVLRRLAGFGKSDHRAGSNMTLIEGTDLAIGTFGVDAPFGAGHVSAGGHLYDERYGEGPTKNRLFVQMWTGSHWTLERVLGKDELRRRGTALRTKIVDVVAPRGLSLKFVRHHDTAADLELDVSTKPGLYEVKVRLDVEGSRGRSAGKAVVYLPIAVGVKKGAAPASFAPRG